MSFLYHITFIKDWESAQEKGFYETESLHEEGFIHLSTEDQYLATAARYYSDFEELTLLKIAKDKLREKIVMENTVGGTELFPHLYGVLNLEAVVSVLKLTKDQSGEFSLGI